MSKRELVSKTSGVTLVSAMVGSALGLVENYIGKDDFLIFNRAIYLK